MLRPDRRDDLVTLEFHLRGSVFATLHHHRLLPESERKRFVTEVTELAIDTPDSGFLDEDLQSIFTADELQQTLQTVREKLLPNLDNVIGAGEAIDPVPSCQ